MTLPTIIGYAGTVCLLCGYIPQAWHTIRTRDTGGIAVPTFLSLGAGSLLFAVQGALLGNIPLLIANAVTAFASAVIFGIKIANDRRNRK